MSGILDLSHGHRWRLDRQLLEAVRHGDIARVHGLLDDGADVNANNGYDSALSLAGRLPESNAAIVGLLLERGADLMGAPRGRGVNPLLRAAHCSEDEIIRLLIRKGARLNLDEHELARSPGLTILQELVRWAELP